MQSRLATPAGTAALGLVGVLPEQAASRPGSKRAYVDLVGVDCRGDVHVIETKIGRDDMLAIQGLDYFTWAEAWSAELREKLVHLGFKVNQRPRIFLDFVLGSDQDRGLDLRTLLPQLEALDGRVIWRIGEVTNWQAGPPAIRWHPRMTSPSEARRSLPPRFSWQLQAHLLKDPESVERRLWWKDLEAETTPVARPGIAAMRQSGRAHRMLGHVRSSQHFAIQLFFGVDVRALARALLGPVTFVDPVEFEFEDPDDRLREASSTSRHQTQVDVLIRATLEDGTRHGLFIEVKLTEDDFGHCGGYASARNDQRELCDRDAPFGNFACFQLRV